MINLEEFVTIFPVTRNKKTMAFSVMIDGTLRINGQLCSKLSPGFLHIRAHPRTGQILLQSSGIKTEAVCSAPKNGVVKTKDLHLLLKNCKITTPARYVVHWEEALDMWLAEHDPHYIFPAQTLKNKLRKPRKTDLSDMLPEKGR